MRSMVVSVGVTASPGTSPDASGAVEAVEAVVAVVVTSAAAAVAAAPVATAADRLPPGRDPSPLPLPLRLPLPGVAERVGVGMRRISCGRA